jgi:hypothetical protein
MLELRLRQFRLSYKKQSEPEVLQRASVNKGEILRNRLESYKAAISAVGGASHDLAAAKRLTERKLRLGGFSQCRSSLCPSNRDRYKNTVYASEQQRGNVAYQRQNR